MNCSQCTESVKRCGVYGKGVVHLTRLYAPHYSGLTTLRGCTQGASIQEGQQTVANWPSLPE